MPLGKTAVAAVREVLEIYTNCEFKTSLSRIPAINKIFEYLGCGVQCGLRPCMQ